MAGIVVLSVGLGMVLISVLLWPLWPLAIMGSVLAVSALIERRYRGGGSPPGTEPGWQPTEEKFIDEESGRLMQVWYHPATGQRDYRPV
jgi:hypothetical protein